MAYSISTFVVSNDDGSAPTSCTVDTTAGTLSLGGPVIPLAALEKFRDGVNELLNQARTDGVLDLTKQVDGGPLLTFAMPDAADPSLDTVKPHSSLAAGWRREKVDGVSGLLAALAQIGLI